jgi:hypothetical protein
LRLIFRVRGNDDRAEGAPSHPADNSRVSSSGMLSIG